MAYHAQTVPGGTPDPATASHAFVESPLQFLSVLEARLIDEALIVHARTQAAGMTGFLAQFPIDRLPSGVVVEAEAPGQDVSPARLPRTSGRVLVGDVLSGSFQRRLLGSLPAVPRELVMVDDGLATIGAARSLTRRRPAPLVRSRLDASPARRALGLATAVVLRRLMRAGRLRWVSAMKVDKRLARDFTGAGGRLARHRFEWARGLNLGDDTSEDAAEPPTVILGSALAADGLIDQDAYASWVADQVRTADQRTVDQSTTDQSTTDQTTEPQAGQCVYYPHRRQSPELLDRLAHIPGLTIAAPGLPVELRLAHSPKHTRVCSLPSTAVTTLPLVMRAPRVEVDPIPAAWWTGRGPDSTRRELNELTHNRLPVKKPRTALVNILAIADSESYLKWAARLVDSLAAAHPGIRVEVVLMDTPIRPTGTQIAHAVSGTRWEDLDVRIVPRTKLRALLTAVRPTVVLAAATGPVAAQVFAVAASLKNRPGLVSGLPGMGLPATLRGQRYRRLGDVFITHSAAERTAYDEAIRRTRARARAVVTTLPMLGSAGRIPPAVTDPVDTVVFAPQAKVPQRWDQRAALLEALAAWQRAGTGQAPRRAILKVRSLPGEQETHAERHSYLQIRRELVTAGALAEAEVEVAVGPMSEFLRPGCALVTVSSTAMLEALDRGLPGLVVSDFGVDRAMLNEVFAGSGLEGTLADLARGRFQHAERSWLEANYFQPATSQLWDEIEELAQQAAAGELERQRTAMLHLGYRRLRAEVRSVMPRQVVTAYRRTRRRLLGWFPGPDGRVLP
ncbi:hypothetical protein NQ038_04130 [Brevibacterium sp. 50QC2O2]|uniref:DUF6716 putative glycosyltransferase n=1 Tax=Brevibacterium TaxID=1696 RepID=UPI00211BB555|nr:MULTISPECIES: DUF6716 putative glycosyltransferase [unclassified Brevibacterium]MCQ9367484.1 hypothetical protein [Brevibacterium sp. 91QC2O2]MCQ9384494.1 hypothetical protein [Brevibacterium sp. 68QC2CO]MCQ9387831.1 hypothetical protein [Brevibacterium sp. 50QC2O2]